nr:Pr6Pr family membrane protein [Brevundimonas lenta]
MLNEPSGRTVAATTLQYFSYFTILGNVLVALALTAPVLAPRSWLGRWSEGEGVRSAVAMYIAVIGVAYHFLLSGPWTPVTPAVVTTVFLHYVMPIAFVIDWLLFTPKGTLRWIDPVKWLSFPALYATWTVAHGYATGFWPYWFVNVPQLGAAKALLWFTILLVVFLAAGSALVVIDRFALRRDSRARAA